MAQRVGDGLAHGGSDDAARAERGTVEVERDQIIFHKAENHPLLRFLFHLRIKHFRGKSKRQTAEQNPDGTKR